MDIVCMGEILIDMFPVEIGRSMMDVSAFYPKPGGAPANVAVAAARLGRKTAFIGKVGDDAFGHSLVEELKSQGVETRGLLIDPVVRTTLVFIAMPDPHHAEFVFYRNPGADFCITPAELDLRLLQSTKAFHCGSLNLTNEPARSATHTGIDTARSAGALISFDVNYRPSLWPGAHEALKQIDLVIPKADLLKINEVELNLLTGSNDLETAPRYLLERGPKLIVVTLGENGSFFCTSAGQGSVPAFQVETVDAIGCGDAFVAGLLTRLTEDKDWVSQLDPQHLQIAFRYASAVGALTALKRGVIPALPDAAQVQDFLAQHS